MPEPSEEHKQIDPVEFAATMQDIAARSQKLVAEFLDKQKEEGGLADPDPMHVTDAFVAFTNQLMNNPAKVVQAQFDLWKGYMDIWNRSAQRWFGGESEPAVKADGGDRRFRDEAWEENVVFDFIKQSYLLTSRWTQDLVAETEGLDPKTKKKVDFYTRQFVDAMAPTNFVMTNPEVLRTTFETNGDNLVHGLQNLLEDLERGKGKLAIRMTDPEAFEVGGNIATAPGKVVYQNDLMQLIQYAPTTEEVYRRPLLIVPPWINKFYILDLREKNSFIRWAVSEGFTVFVVSWVNPDEHLSRKSFDDYMLEGPIAALGAIEQATGEKEANVIGYCIGGTLMAATLAHMTAKGDDRFKSVTFFTTMVDFEEAGELGVFIDEAQLASLEEKMNKRGYLDGAEMANTFNMLRANDLIWSFVVNNYLLGKDPFPFDLLYWNSDSTRMPAVMHSFYLRKMYQENKLVEPGALTLAGTPIDLTTIKTPAFILSTKEDHIAPWKSTYRATQIYSGPIKFCLAGSGHIAGVVNPPSDKPKYGFYSNSRKPKTPEKWLEGATYNEGSWWPEWAKWISRHGGGKVPARVPGDRQLEVIEDAPGSYVKLKAKD
ncbi:PHA/PHB synthase family protein [Nisaea sediminum]|uniref:PHA/PHB synthase family protein n=1 Tax=Nisaea sediminum TaxID=2775867 RepID=UPI00186963B9|nr:class I poly(R)-hydroxyalkanoic acid synthase [Nisaea sediminum]